MEYHLDRTIRFVTEEEFKNLYRWSLQEFTADGAGGAKQIPWVWTLSFAATEMRHVHNIEGGVDRNDNPRTQSDSESITFVLRPDGWSNPYPPRFSMFGTDRVIKSFSLRVQCLDEGKPELCTVWGSPSYTAEIDFRNDTEEDVLAFQLWLSPRNFETLRRAAQHGNGEYVVGLSVSGVSGFYSEWSPSISTDRVKVLAAGTEQSVAVPAGVGDLPRLGNIADFKLYVTRRSPLSSWRATQVTEEPDAVGEQAIADAVPLPVHNERDDATVLAELTRLQKSIATLRLPMWLLLLVAIAVLVFHH